MKNYRNMYTFYAWNYLHEFGIENKKENYKWTVKAMNRCYDLGVCYGHCIDYVILPYYAEIGNKK